MSLSQQVLSLFWVWCDNDAYPAENCLWNMTSKCHWIIWLWVVTYWMFTFYDNGKQMLWKNLLVKINVTFCFLIRILFSRIFIYFSLGNKLLIDRTEMRTQSWLIYEYFYYNWMGGWTCKATQLSDINTVNLYLSHIRLMGLKFRTERKRLPFWPARTATTSHYCWPDQR